MARARLSNVRLRRGATRLAFFVPALFLLATFIVVPVAWSFYISFFSDLPSQGGEPIGFDNYAEVLGSRTTLNLEDFPDWPPLGTLMHNAIWIVLHLPLSLFAGLWLAMVLREVKGASFVKSSIFVGMVTPLIVGGIIFRFIYDVGAGFVPAFFDTVGYEPLAVGWINHRETILFGLIFGSVWLWTGFSLIVYSAGLTTIPDDYFEAARIDGASRWRTFTRVTFPLLRPMTLVIITMTILWELKIFDIVVSATNFGGGVGGAADVLALQMYRLAFIPPFEYGQAAAVATLLTALTLVATGYAFRRLVLRK